MLSGKKKKNADKFHPSLDSTKKEERRGEAFSAKPTWQLPLFHARASPPSPPSPDLAANERTSCHAFAGDLS